MITLKEWMEVVDYRITEGSEYYAYGGAYSLSSWDGNQQGHSLEIIFDRKTQVVYEVQALDYKHNRAYRLFNVDYKQQMVKPEPFAWDDVKWVDLESDDDWFQKARAIVAGEDYDTRVSLPLELPDDVLLVLMKRAHELDITFNQHMENIIKDYIETAKDTK